MSTAPPDTGPGMDAVERLQASEARYRSLVQAQVNEVWTADTSGRLLSDMPVWRAVSGQSVADLLGHGWLRAVHPDDREPVRATWAAALGTGRPYVTEYRIGPVDLDPAEWGSRVRVFAVRGVPVQRDGVTVEWVGVSIDVTVARAAEAERARLAALADRAARRTAVLQRVTAELSGALTPSDVIAVILRHARASVGASGSGVALLEAGSGLVRYHSLSGYGAEVAADWQQFPVDQHSPVTEVLRSGLPLFVSSATALLEQFPSPQMRAFVAASGERSWTRLPLAIGAAAPTGVLSLGFADERTFGQDERIFLLGLAGLCAQAIERAALYARERDTAVALQRSLLPDHLPTDHRVGLAARYLPATTGVEVGGDWYDAFRLPDGRLALVVGDVIGKGATAASVMGQVRNALRGLVLVDPDPGVVLDLLDQLVGRVDDGPTGDEQLVTVAYAVLDPATGRLRHASAGHPAGLVRGADGAVRWLDHGRSMPLGLAERGRGTAEEVLAPGELLVLVTDGLVESRSRPVGDGLAELAEVVRAAQPELPRLDALAEALVRELAPGPSREDDVTLLLAHLPAAADPTPATVSPVSVGPSS